MTPHEGSSATLPGGAWRWPHSDTRNHGAILVGTVVLVVGLAAAAFARAGRRGCSSSRFLPFSRPGL